MTIILTFWSTSVIKINRKEIEILFFFSSRFNNSEITENIEGVIEIIWEKLYR